VDFQFDQVWLSKDHDLDRLGRFPGRQFDSSNFGNDPDLQKKEESNPARRRDEGFSRSYDRRRARLTTSQSVIAVAISFDMTPRPPILTLMFQSRISYSRVAMSIFLVFFWSSGHPMIFCPHARRLSFSSSTELSFPALTPYLLTWRKRRKRSGEISERDAKKWVEIERMDEP